MVPCFYCIATLVTNDEEIIKKAKENFRHCVNRVWSKWVVMMTAWTTQLM